MKQIEPAADSEGEHSESVSGFFRSLRGLMSRTRWMRPVHSCRQMSGAEFGRNIQRELKALGEADSFGVLAVSIRKKTRAVVITPEHYEELRQIHDKVETLIAAQARTEVEDATDNFELLYSRITAEQSQAASRALFSVTGEELADSYRPGATETAP